MKTLRSALAVLLVLSAPVAVLAERAPPAGGVLSLIPLPAETDHSIVVDGRTIDYRARTGTLPLMSGSGQVTAEIFHVAYTLLRKPAARPDPARPVTFVFNGGPGAASAYLHLGALGPRVIATGANGGFLPPPQRLIDNPSTWLDMTDLVFVDPVGTGYSREAPGTEARSFWGVDQDARAMGSFIRLYLAQSGRAGSPVFLAGESYGGFRAALLASRLAEEAGISPSGVILLSPALEFTFLRPDEFQPLHWALGLPSLAAVRLSRQGVVGDEFRARLAEVERFALGDYLVALASGLEAGKRAAAGRVAEITGLSLDLVERNFARIPVTLFAKQAARPEGNVLSLYDGTIETADLAPERPDLAGPDPVLDRSVPVLSSAFVAYARGELNFHTDLSYRVLNREISGNWDYGNSPTRQGYAGVMDDLQKARSLNPRMSVLIVHGYTDLVTPYMTSRYLAGQIPILPGAEPVRLEVLEGGHMMYFRATSRAALKKAAAALFEPVPAGRT